MGDGYSRKVGRTKGRHGGTFFLALSLCVNQAADVAEGAGAVRAGPPLGGVDAVALVARELDLAAVLGAAGGARVVGHGHAGLAGGRADCAELLLHALSLVLARVILPEGHDLADVASDAM